MHQIVMDFVTFGREHNLYMIGTFAIWFIVLFFGKVILNVMTGVGNIASPVVSL